MIGNPTIRRLLAPALLAVLGFGCGKDALKTLTKKTDEFEQNDPAPGESPRWPEH
jgi:hypothetical protein